MELTEETALAASEAFIRDIPPYPGGYEGRGIVICGGGRFFVSAWVLINMLRHVGCTLPVELWHLGPSEIDDEMKALLAPLGVSFVDAWEVRKAHPLRKMDGWELKPFAILHSRFREVMLLDADIVPARDPTVLFDRAPYIEHGALFWPDAKRLSEKRMIWGICGVEYQDEPEFETGQVVIDKMRCWDAINLTLWYNEHSYLYYIHIYGDKDTFHMAWRKTGHKYGMAAEHTVYVNYMFFQNGFDDYVMFQHQKKWNLSATEAPGCLVFPDECLAYVAELRARWSGDFLPDKGTSWQP